MVSQLCQELVHFIDASPTPYHAVANATTRLESAGFHRIMEGQDFGGLSVGGYFFTRGDSALVAFILPSRLARSKVRGFRIIGAHTDSPNLRLKPNALYSKENYLQLGIEVYGGALLNTWLDRDLSLAGRVVFRSSEGLTSQLLQIHRPLLRIPQLAIHLDREVNDRGLILNRQEHLNPILGLLQSRDSGSNSLADLCAQELDISPEDIVASELMLYDRVPATLGGLDREFIFAPRLDNLSMCHAALASLIEVKPQVKEGIVPVIALFDHEEVGSHSAYGAGTPLIPMVLERLVMATQGTRETYFQALAGSFCISADTAHAVHPNYAERHDPRHRPQINQGPVIKINQQQRYATSALTSAIFQELCRKNNVPVQFYAHRSDLPCGSTIGPITSTLLGIPTLDVGNPVLSMHSIREMAGSQDLDLMIPPLVDFLRYSHPSTSG